MMDAQRISFGYKLLMGAGDLGAWVLTEYPKDFDDGAVSAPGRDIHQVGDKIRDKVRAASFSAVTPCLSKVTCEEIT